MVDYFKYVFHDNIIKMIIYVIINMRQSIKHNHWQRKRFGDWVLIRLLIMYIVTGTILKKVCHKLMISMGKDQHQKLSIKNGHIERDINKTRQQLF